MEINLTRINLFKTLLKRFTWNSFYIHLTGQDLYKFFKALQKKIGGIIILKQNIVFLYLHDPKGSLISF